MMRLHGFETNLADVWCIERSLITDERGFLSRLFCSNELSAFGWRWPIVQINHACTEKSGTVRGMHFQKYPNCEAKLVSCIKGSIWDVAVDLRRGSPTFLKWTAQVLSAENRRALLIPPGFAHGFQSLQDNSELLYCHSHAYAARSDAGLNPLDPKVEITWPEAITLISNKDSQQSLLDENFEGLTP